MTTNRTIYGNISDSTSLTIEEENEQFRKNLKDTFPDLTDEQIDHMVTEYCGSMTDLDIDDEWKLYIQHFFEKVVLSATSIRHLKGILKKWHWLVFAGETVAEAIEVIDLTGAGTAKQLADFYDLHLKKKLGRYPTEKEIFNLSQRCLKTYKKMRRCGLVDRIMTPIKRGRMNAAIWIAPKQFRNPADDYDEVEEALLDYEESGGVVGTVSDLKREKDKTAPITRVFNHNDEVKFRKAMDDTLKIASYHNFVKCPNECPTSIRKYLSESFSIHCNFKGEIEKLYCSECDSKLIETTPEDYTTLYFTTTYNRDIPNIKKKKSEKNTSKITVTKKKVNRRRKRGKSKKK